MLLLSLVIIVTASLTTGLNFPCCSQVPGSCRTSCEQMSLVAVAINTSDRRKYLHLLDIYCPKQLGEFWSCVNSTLKDVDLNSHWSGRQCCRLPMSDNCQLTCLMSQNRSQLLSGCRQSDEILFYDCLDTQEIGDKCCGGAKTSECETACKDIFVTNGHSRTTVETVCSPHSPSVVNCVHEHTKATPSNNSHKNLYCCDRSNNEQCKSTCKMVLRASSSSQEAVMDRLIKGGCGDPQLHDSLWQCFLSNSETNRPSGSSGSFLTSNSRRYSSVSSISGSRAKLGYFDGAKLHCCLKAYSLQCQKLCFRTFSNDWELKWKDFHRSCMYQPSELKMLRCIEEVDEPCELGCDGLSYCSYFNNQPTQMFRSCNSWTDRGARSEVEMWKTGFINTSSFVIPILDTGQCFPAMLKPIACMLAVKPCTNQQSFTGLCRLDCVESLTKCVDSSRLPPGITPSTICDLLLPPGHDASCTPLSTYISDERASYAQSRARVTFPCRPNPCSSNHICVLNRDCPDGKPKCPLYKCVPGCRMGDTSQLLVHPNTMTYIPSSAHDTGSYKICRCSSKAQFEECVNLPSQSTDGCFIGGKKILHRSTFQFDCNTCLCFAGEVTCTTQECSITESRDVVYGSGIPCNCPSHYVPVCGANGRTYPSACVALCAGLSEDRFTFGLCSNVDPCKSNPCERNQRCFPDRKICLSSDNPAKCVQYVCVNKTRDCPESLSSPVCDTDQKQFNSICSLVSEERIFAYNGNCIKNCKNVGKVCGQDGETYLSECAALAARTLVDYTGQCITVAKTIGGSFKNCESIQCSKPVEDKCQLVTPPGTCCPICGAAVRFLLNQRQTRQIEDYIREDEYLTVGGVVDIFRQHIRVFECEVYGYLSVDGEFVLVVTSLLSSPSPLQLQACVKEAEKLELRVNTGSPLIVTNFKLSSITLAIAVDSRSFAHVTQPSYICLLASLIMLYFNIKGSYLT